MSKTEQKSGKLWSDQQSIALTKVCTLALLAAAVALLLAGPWLIDWLLANRPMRTAPGVGAMGYGELATSEAPAARGAARALLYFVGYGCGAAALTMLWQLYRFLRRVERGGVFTAQNVSALRGISWCCLAAALLALLAGAVLYRPFLFIAGAAGFMALIVRVIKNAFAQAVLMKNELDFTV